MVGAQRLTSVTVVVGFDGCRHSYSGTIIPPHDTVDSIIQHGESGRDLAAISQGFLQRQPPARA